MTQEVKELYESSIVDEFFLEEIYDADGDKKPSRYDSNNKKVLFASIYYGWLVGIYGSKWRKGLKTNKN